MAGFSGADIKSLCQEAAMLALRSDIGAQAIGEEHLAGARLVVKGSLRNVTLAHPLDRRRSHTH
jgi:SpoVK/Ycf46/Vps4 family AAA+-type ATPase